MDLTMDILSARCFLPSSFLFLGAQFVLPPFLTVHPSADKLHILDPKGSNDMHLMHWVRPPLLDGKVEETDLSQWRSSASMASLFSREGQHFRVRIMLTQLRKFSQGPHRSPPSRRIAHNSLLLLET
jgi:hypothetical protein